MITPTRRSLLGTPLAAAQTRHPERAYWLALLQKVAQPVLENLAAGKLRQNMPVEALRADLVDGRRRFTHLEAFGRTMCGLAPWLELNSSDPRLGEFRRWADQALEQAVHPASPDYCNFRTEGQPVVDAAFLALALLRSPQWWSRASSRTKSQTLEALRLTRATRPGFNNWLLFSAMIETFFLQVDAGHDKMRLDYALRQHEQWYKGDGHYGDGPDFHWDYYNSFVIQPFLTEILERVPGYDQQRDRHRKIAARYAEIQERLIAPDGSFPAIGRSLCYRTGVFHHLADQALRQRLALPPGQVRAALTATLRRTLDPSANFDSRGWLRLGLTASQPALAESYISTGSLYLAAAAFLPLGLPAESPFWRDPAQDWTAQRIWRGDNLPADHALRL